jgi:hypothetical protein
LVVRGLKAANTLCPVNQLPPETVTKIFSLTKCPRFSWFPRKYRNESLDSGHSHLSVLARVSTDIFVTLDQDQSVGVIPRRWFCFGGAGFHRSVEDILCYTASKDTQSVGRFSEYTCDVGFQQLSLLGVPHHDSLSIGGPCRNTPPAPMLEWLTILGNPPNSSQLFLLFSGHSPFEEASSSWLFFIAWKPFWAISRSPFI